MNEANGALHVRVGLVFLGRKRPGFDPEWGQTMANAVRETVRKTSFDIFEPSEKVVDDATLCAALDACKREGVDVVVVLQTTMSDARLAPTFVQRWPDSILLWATPERPDGDKVSSCSLVGAHAWASVLRHMRHPFDLLYGPPSDPRTRNELCDAVRRIYVAQKLRSARVGIVGGQAPGFFAMSVDPFSVPSGLGPQVQLFSLVEFVERTREVSDDEVAADVERVKAIGLPHKDTTDADLPLASRLYLAMRHYFEAEGVDALALRCWPELPNVVGQWPYLGMARLADEGFAIACEGDADGALTAWIGEKPGLGRCYLSDWLEHDDETIVLWHGGNIPFSLCPPPGRNGGPQIARHFNNQKPAVVESTLRAGMPVTLCRIWRLDGTYRMTACEGVTLWPRRHLMGSNGLVQLSDRNPDEWFRTLCHEGMPHHIAVFEGHHAKQLKRFAQLIEIDWID